MDTKSNFAFMYYIDCQRDKEVVTKTVGRRNRMSRYIEVRGVKIGKGIPKICVPIVGVTQNEILAEAQNVESKKIDMVEWRADWFENVFDYENVKEVLKGLRAILENIPLLFTFRTAKEGGQKEIEPKGYAKLNKQVSESGLVDLIDVELFMGDPYVSDIIYTAQKAGVGVIVSNHDFEKTPEKEEMLSRLCKMQDLGADILKIAVMPQSKKDVCTLLLTTEEMKSKHAKQPIVTMSMGDLGLVSRLCGEAFGSALTFGAVGKTSAPGQIAVEKLYAILNSIHGYLNSEFTQANIFLIGFMGTGKSTIAEELKYMIGVDSVEMDQMIVNRTQMSISEIFAKYGEEYFRDLETNLLLEITESESMLVSCGGGTVIRKENVEYMKKSGHIVLLTATPETIYERVKNSTDRPILNQNMSVEFIAELMERRRERYLQAADLVVSTDGKTTEEICEEILIKLKGDHHASI